MTPIETVRSAHARVATDTGRASVDALVDALDELASSARVSVSRGKMRRSVSLALASRAGIEWPEALRSAGATVGLSVRVYELSPTDVATHAASLRPLVTLVERAGAPSAIVLLPRDGGLSWVEPRHGGRPAPVDAHELAKLLGIAPDGVALVAAAEPSESLDVMHRAATTGLPLARLFALFRLEKDDLWATVIYAIFIGLLSLAAPLVVQTLVNTLAFGALVQPLVVLTTLLFIGLAFAGALRAIQAWVVERVQQRLFVRVALDLAHRLTRVAGSALRSAHGPELVNRFLDVATIQKGAASLLVEGIAIVLQTVVGMLLLSAYHPLLLTFAVILAASIALVVLALGRGATSTALKESKEKFAVTAWLQETIRHRSAFGSEDGAAAALAHAEDLTREWLGARRKHWSIVFRQMVGALVLEAVASAALLGVGGALVLARQLTLGQLVAAELIVATVVAGVSKLGKYLESAYDLLASVDKIGQLVDLPLERAGSSVHAAGPASLAIEDLSVERGGRLGLHALDGRSADELTDVLAGDADAVDTRFELDGVDARELSPAAIREAMYVVRGPELFAGTIADNVARGRTCSPLELRAALARVGAWGLVAALPEGLRTQVSTHAPTLTREEALRLTLARVVLTQPRVVVVDRALDGLPAPARDELLDALGAADAPWTFVLVSSDAATASRLGTMAAIGGGRRA